MSPASLTCVHCPVVLTYSLRIHDRASCRLVSPHANIELGIGAEQSVNDIVQFHGLWPNVEHINRCMRGAIVLVWNALLFFRKQLFLGPIYVCVRCPLLDTAFISKGL